MNTPRDLPQLLGGARRWFEEALLSAMEHDGPPVVSPTQLHLFAALDEEGTTVAELARRMGVTRQTAHQAVHALVASGLLEQLPDPDSARRRLIRRTREGARAHRRAVRVLEQAEEALRARIGPQLADALRTALESPWGAPPSL